VTTRYYVYEDADGAEVVGSSNVIPEGARELSAAFYDKALERSQRASKARERAAEKAGQLKDDAQANELAAARAELDALGLSQATIVLLLGRNSVRQGGD
jgi:hypothetical protein